MISQQKVEEASLFWHRWRQKNYLSVTKRSFDQRVTRILKV